MKSNQTRKQSFLISPLILGLAGMLASAVAGRAQVILHPNQISGNIHFSNVNPAILNLLNAPGNEGMSNVIVIADSLPPAPSISAQTGYLPVSSRTSAGYQITVDSDNTGISYAVYPRILMEGTQYTYWFSAATSAPVTIGTPPPALDFSECVGVVTIQFVNSSLAPVAVDGGIITAFDSGNNYSGQLGPIPAGATQQRIYLRGGDTHRLEITVNRGTNLYADRIESFLSTNVPVTCDQLTTITMVIPSASSLATITGTVDMLREFNLTVSGNTSLQFPDYTAVIADNGPFANKRYAATPGVNFTTSSSGAYTLPQVFPSTLDPGSSGYRVYAQMAFRTNRMIEVFHTPALGEGSNAPLAVTPGAAINLGNTFVIDPGYLHGNIVLQGPAESLGRASLLRGIQHAGDDTTDGIPTSLGTYGVYWSTVDASGVDRLAPGATHTAELGQGVVDFDGNFNALGSAFEGHYDMALGGLNGEHSLWKQDTTTLFLYSGTVNNDSDYFYNFFDITDARTNDLELVPNQTVTHDIGYCFSEVKVVFRTTSGTLYSPQVRFSTGTFTGTDFQGHAADYSVYIDGMFGTPDSLANASNIGVVTMYLPQGTYTLYPSVNPGGSAFELAGLQPIDITVGCGQRIALEPCLQVNLNAPDCSNNRTVAIGGSVRSCGNNVTSISYVLNGAPSQVVCNNCGADPNFSFNINLTGECVDNTLTVTATDGSGGSSSVTTAIHYDATPPVIQCPTNMVVSACDTNGQIVNFSVTATDNCSGPVTVVCNPPSGSLFPFGVTTVNCLATDPCGNTNNCSFTVTVGGPALTIEIAVIVKWNCGGTLQSADNASGPWSDIPGATSPYCVAASGAQKFYRVRN